MAVTITRSVWIDDDGTGQSGTVINQALHTTLYNEIDTALAKVAQLAGGNTFTGSQVFNPTTILLINTPSVLFGGALISVAQSFGVGPALVIQNSYATPTGNFQVFLNNTGAVAGYIAHTGSTTVAFGTSSDARLKSDEGRARDLAALRAVVVHDFTWTADGVADRGIFAQDTYRVFPRAIIRGTDERTPTGDLACPWATDYSKFVPDLIVGWQQHDVEIAALRTFLALAKG